MRRERAIALLGAATGIWLLLWAQLRFELKVDSAGYLLVAEGLKLTGDRVRVFFESRPFSLAFVPHLQQPPGYPLLIAGLSQLRGDSVYAAMRALHAIVGVLTFVRLWTLLGRRTLLAFSMCLGLPVLWSSTVGLTGGLLTLLCLEALARSARALGTEGRQAALDCALVALAIVAATWVRYVGSALLVLALPLGFGLLRQRRWQTLAVLTTTGIAAAAATLLPTLWVNRSVAGSFGGELRAPNTLPLWTHLRDLLGGVGGCFSPWESSWVGLVVVVSCGVAVATMRDRSEDRRIAVGALLVAFGLLALTLALRAIADFDRLGLRFAVPTGVLLGVALGAARSAGRWADWVLVALVVGSLAASVTRLELGPASDPRMHPTFRELRRSVTPDSAIYASWHLRTTWATGLSARALPRLLGPDDWEARLRATLRHSGDIFYVLDPRDTAKRRRRFHRFAEAAEADGLVKVRADSGVELWHRPHRYRAATARPLEVPSLTVGEGGDAQHFVSPLARHQTSYSGAGAWLPGPTPQLRAKAVEAVPLALGQRLALLRPPTMQHRRVPGRLAAPILDWQRERGSACDRFGVTLCLRQGEAATMVTTVDTADLERPRLVGIVRASDGRTAPKLQIVAELDGDRIYEGGGGDTFLVVPLPRRDVGRLRVGVRSVRDLHPSDRNAVVYLEGFAVIDGEAPAERE